MTVIIVIATIVAAYKMISKDASYFYNQELRYKQERIKRKLNRSKRYAHA